MIESFKVKKVLNNNVLIATHSSYNEVVLIGKGIGFGKKQGDDISQLKAEKMFVLENEKEQEQYKKLVSQVDEGFIEVMNDIILHIRKRVESPINEHIHVALTDHISFAIKRMNQGLSLANPFLIETKSLYPMEYNVAQEVVAILNEKMGITFPKGEVGFIALHIHSAIGNKTISEVNQHSHLIANLITIIEGQLKIKINRDSIDYLQLIRHLYYTIARVKSGDKVEEPKNVAKVLKSEYPICYNLSWKVIKVMQQALKLQVYDAEAVYLTMHLQRLTNKNE
ncbi:glucose PTS transporter transcription antiterminator GlcT [Ferdinandcohnia quinoae]|uniref:Transcription antiterminator n=1 Tax=Fredinandcohnia quinoae TaxID=2918902 RepID=A0AAW5DUD8_9BACI|nr:transcription antiterminator [Fredinandcohnia sp. SECRCQ15]MCH1623978.1 transcription antiterminator [Fredinandcohnia sp. SECRCQ15]